MPTAIQNAPIPLYRTDRKFDAKKEALHIRSWIRAWYDENAPGGNAIIGISGGKDSTVAARLLVDALGPERVYGVLMPNHGQSDLDDARRIAEMLHIRHCVADIGTATDASRGVIEKAARELLGKDAYGPDMTNTDINLPPRTRMTVLYGIAPTLPGKTMVCNTCNLSEDYVGYSTKYGDSAGDFAPLAEYTATEIIEIGLAAGLPEWTVRKTPSDGLCGKSDEERFGFSYAVLDKYIRTGVCEDEAVRRRIEYMHASNLHKLRVIPSCPSWHEEEAA